MGVGLCSVIDKLIHDLEIVKPTIMLAVPRIFEKIYARVQRIHEIVESKENSFIGLLMSLILTMKKSI
jgi:long-subunit acyl-CoA synthetase (AMP-forming)